MSGRKGTVIWVCTVVILAVLPLSGGIGIGVATAADTPEFQGVEATLEAGDGVIDAKDVETGPTEMEIVESIELSAAGTHGPSVTHVSIGTLIGLDPGSPAQVSDSDEEDDESDSDEEDDESDSDEEDDEDGEDEEDDESDSDEEDDEDGEDEEDEEDGEDEEDEEDGEHEEDEEAEPDAPGQGTDAPGQERDSDEEETDSDGTESDEPEIDSPGQGPDSDGTESDEPEIDSPGQGPDSDETDSEETEPDSPDRGPDSDETDSDEPGSPGPEPGSDEPDSDEPDSNESEPDSNEGETDAPGQGPDSDEPDPDEDEPDPDEDEPDPDEDEPDPDETEPDPDETEPDPDETETDAPGQDSDSDETDSDEPASDSTETETDTPDEEPNSEETEPDSDESDPDETEPDPGESDSDETGPDSTETESNAPDTESDSSTETDSPGTDSDANGNTDSGGGGESSGSSGSSGSTDSSGSAAAGDEEPTVVRSESDESVTVDVDGAAGEPYDTAVNLAGPSNSAPAVSVSSVAVDPAGDRAALETTIGRPTADPSGRDPVPRGVALGYIEFDSTLGPDDTSAATLRFDIDEEAIPRGLGPEDVAVRRYADGEWTTENVEHDVEGDTHAVTLPHATPVAVVALEPGRVEVVESEVPADHVRAGYETTLRATVENPGDRPVTRTLTVSMNGEPVAEREVALDPGENATVEITFRPRESGTVSLEGDEVGEITLFDDDDDATPTDTETNEDAPGFGVSAAVLALLVAAFGVRVRRS